MHLVNNYKWSLRARLRQTNAILPTEVDDLIEKYCPEFYKLELTSCTVPLCDCSFGLLHLIASQLLKQPGGWI